MEEQDVLSPRLPQLGALRAFEAAARYENLTRAAAELHVTHGAVSKQIKSLEADLGEALFHRRNRSVILTERGRWLASRLRSMFAELESTFANFRSNGPAQPLVVSCEPTLCLKFLIPSLSAIRLETGVDVRVLAAGGSIDFRRDHIDLAIRRNDFPIEGDIATTVLCDEAVGPVCSPAVLARSSSDGSKSMLPALHTRTRPDAWAAWRRMGRPVVTCGSNVTYEHFYMALEAAIAGEGIALASIHMVGRDLVAGRLQSLCGFWRDGTQYLALSSHDVEEERRDRLVQWLAARMQDALFADIANP